MKLGVPDPLNWKMERSLINDQSQKLDPEVGTTQPEVDTIQPEVNKISPYPLTQCAAVRTNLLVMMEPPQ